MYDLTYYLTHRFCVCQFGHGIIASFESSKDAILFAHDLKRFRTWVPGVINTDGLYVKEF